MRRPSIRTLLLAVLTLLLTNACVPSREAITPGTVPPEPSVDESDYQAGREVRAKLIEQFGEWKNPTALARVQTIVNRLFQAHPRQGTWTVTLLDGAEVVNAAATRGNQIFVWRGMLEQVKDDEVLAAVVAHEIAHVRAGHVTPEPAEIANRMIAAIAGAATGAVIQNRGAAQQTAQTAGAVASATIAGAIVNPYSQQLELEADTIGLFLMADAGYNPEKALEFWKSSKNEGSRLGQFFSTHPLSNTRIENLTQHLPQAKQRYFANR